METKFLSDGRKVAVVGSLNSVEFIVQEIFVTKEGDEIPSGERFTTKSLHDSPVESYANREKSRINSEIAKLQLEAENALREVKKLREERKFNQALLSEIKKITAGISKLDAKFLADALSGNVKYAVNASYYSVEEPVLFDSLIKQSDRYDFESLKLMTVFGRSNGDLTYKINQYSDGSGSSNEYFFARDESELSAAYKKKCERSINVRRENNQNFEDHCSISDMEIYLKYGVKISKEMQSKIVNKAISRIEERKNNDADTHKKSLEKMEEDLSVLRAKLKSSK